MQDNFKNKKKLKEKFTIPIGNIIYIVLVLILFLLYGFKSKKS
jgi:hypothetical protein